MKQAIAICMMLCISAFITRAQQIQETPPAKQDYYQIFLEAPIQKVNKVTYSNDSGSIQFKLSPDGKTIRLLDYNSEGGGIKAEVVNAEGAVTDVIKSKCNVHSLQEL